MKHLHPAKDLFPLVASKKKLSVPWQLLRRQITMTIIFITLAIFITTQLFAQQSIGSIHIDPARTDSCETGRICIKYVLPAATVGGVNSTGELVIAMAIYQNLNEANPHYLMNTITSPVINSYSWDSSYYINIDPAYININSSPGGFDYILTGSFTLNGSALPPVVLGDPLEGQKPGYNKDYLVSCSGVCSVGPFSYITNETDNNANGSVVVTVSGIPPYTFTLNGITNNSGIFTGLTAGNYALAISDANQCTGGASITVGRTITIDPSKCPHDTIIMADPNTCTAVVNWTAPSLQYPDSLTIPISVLAPESTIRLKGIYNGHGYYQSVDSYGWIDAQNSVGSVLGHLASITDAGESAFIKTYLPQPDFGAWIGLYNPGNGFTWITGEPFNYTDWNTNEPSNANGTANFVGEPYVHIRGAAPNDRWNDLPDGWKLPFIAEFDTPILTYTQTSGPAPGSAVAAGEYTVCYQIYNNVTHVYTSCCFKLSVVCSGTSPLCPADTTITVAGTNCTTSVKWTIPSTAFPPSIPIAGGDAFAPGTGHLNLKGIYGGHGYYYSDDTYYWPRARDIAAAANGHLVTINNAGEGVFVKINLPQPDFGAWIGLYNTGTVGSFTWVNGEALVYTDWNNNEPNNGGSTTSIVEPYVHIRGGTPNDKWNDLSADWRLQFIAEFDNPVLTYKQLSGIAWGSNQGPGTYNVCYEIINHATGQTAVCCFDVTVACNTAPSLRSAAINTATNAPIFANKQSVATVYPNPAKTGENFSIQLKGDAAGEKIIIMAYDVFGRLIETKTGLSPNSIILMGSDYRPGMYILQVIQGRNRMPLKITKQ